jgi:hypothetical protein
MSVFCDRCERVYPGFCDRCAYLRANMVRWRKVAEHVHGQACDGKHSPRDCGAYLETVYGEFMAGRL